MHASILVVGDNDFSSAVLSQLDDLGEYTAQKAIDICEALQLIQAQQPDVVVMKSQLADGSGLQLCERIKAQPKLAWIYCILLHGDSPTHRLALEGLGDEEIAVGFLEAGADVFQPQALSPRLLLAHIRAGLRMVYNHRSLVRTNDLLASIALSDPLTELNNRRALESDLPRQVQNACSRGLPLSLIMLDVDFFKSINDRYGHLAGDQALRLLANRLQHNLRFHDTLFRYGGEEFVIILSNTDLPEAARVSNRLRSLVSDQPFALDERTVLNITVSMGTACLQEADDNQGISLLHRADQNLLRAKAGGRNCVVSCVEGVEPPEPAPSSLNLSQGLP